MCVWVCSVVHGCVELARLSWPTTSRQSRGYDAAWDKLRLTILKRDCYLCQCNECKGGKVRVTPANEVHHIVSKAEGKVKGWARDKMDAPDNLQSINKECHKRETLAEQGKQITPAVSIGLDGWPV